jgi:leader peptidase (prepilin peptidase) / N-methyltransferase
MLLAPLTIFWMVVVFILGCNIGSFLNVVVARLPMEKSILWPGSRCGRCLQAIRWYDNIPILSYLLLRGKCRTCGVGFSVRYLLVELATGLGFLGLFWLEMVVNVHGWPPQFGIQFGHFPLGWWFGYGFHAILFSLLMAASVCDLERREIPLPLTTFGAVVGLLGATLFPWPWPATAAQPMVPAMFGPRIEAGIYAWPFWLPLPDWSPPGSPLTGFLTGLCGLLVGTFLLRLIAFVFGFGLGREALGLGDADLMMMAGAFLGWQLVIAAFFVSVLPALLFGAFNFFVYRDRSLPFGPSLAVGLMTACLCWRWIGPSFQPAFFNAWIIVGLLAFMTVFLFLSSSFLRWMRR